MNEIFNAKSLVRECEKEYTKRYFPNNQVLSLEEYAKEYDLKTVKYYELANSEIWGMPYAVTYNENGKLSVTFQDAAHSLVVGTTQVGKTWGHVMDNVFTLSAKKNKPNFMIADPKGEISENTVEVLKQRGYRIFALNFKNTKFSNMWNPLLEIYDNWMEMNLIEDRLKYHSSLRGLSKLELNDHRNAFEKAGCYWSFDGVAYSDPDDADAAVLYAKSQIESATFDLVNQLVSSLGASAVEKSKDPGWQTGALEIIRGMIYLMLEDALDKRSGFERQNMNFMNMQRYYEIIRDSVLTGMSNTALTNTIKLGHKKISDESIRHMRAYFENAPTTSRSYLGCFENIMQGWFNPKIYSIANDNNVDISGPDDTPFALFLITRDYEKSDYFIAGLFVDWVYKEMLTKAERLGGKLDREMFFILDEFANIPVINGFTSKISTSLSRRIIFQLYIQSYEQLEGNYGASDAGTIRGNCNVEIFLGSQSYKTKKEFSDKCGTRRIRTLDSALSPDKRALIETPALSINALENLKQGDAYIKRLNRPTAKTHFEMAYMCEEFAHNKVSAAEFGIKAKPYNDESFVYKYLENEYSMSNQSRVKRDERIKEFFI
ncbi:MAG: type IV secretory system conjugative DNA transfer family protein [Clostridia bacterium]|nr:type IV secretory system conjugative DNA transfer family protein [Clostridia bacterium]